MGGQVLTPLAVGALTAGITYAFDPTPPWWLVGVIVAVVLLVNPRAPR